MSADAVLQEIPLGFPWQTLDPFLFCVHHDDAYPAGNGVLGPAASLGGRNMGQDFAGKDGWRMYHGQAVPGFPYHPHRGFETVTLVRRGFIDHSDSLGATARFGQGDAQWLTAGRGIVHAEMFPLLQTDRPNPVELFQIWLNLPKRDKMVEPHFAMLWHEAIPLHEVQDSKGRVTRITIVAGRMEGVTPPPSPPPHSWASQAQSDVAIWSVNMEPGAQWVLPPARSGTNRVLYFFAGQGLTVAGHKVDSHRGLLLTPDVPVDLQAGDTRTEVLLLQGQPLGEPVVQHGPFVMNSPAEIRQAFADYQRTQFGGWPWPSPEPVHPRGKGRFARHADGKVEVRET